MNKKFSVVAIPENNLNQSVIQSFEYSIKFHELLRETCREIMSANSDKSSYIINKEKVLLLTLALVRGVIPEERALLDELDKLSKIINDDVFLIIAHDEKKFPVSHLEMKTLLTYNKYLPVCPDEFYLLKSMKNDKQATYMIIDRILWSADSVDVVRDTINVTISKDSEFITSGEVNVNKHKLLKSINQQLLTMNSIGKQEPYCSISSGIQFDNHKAQETKSPFMITASGESMKLANLDIKENNIVMNLVLLTPSYDNKSKTKAHYYRRIDCTISNDNPVFEDMLKDDIASLPREFAKLIYAQIVKELTYNVKVKGLEWNSYDLTLLPI